MQKKSNTDRLMTVISITFTVAMIALFAVGAAFAGDTASAGTDITLPVVGAVSLLVLAMVAGGGKKKPVKKKKATKRKAKKLTAKQKKQLLKELMS